MGGCSSRCRSTAVSPWMVAFLAGGLVLGTLHYMSPEQASGGEVDIRSDLWSFGVVLYEMIEGKRPITAEQPEAVVSSIIGSSIDVTPSKAASAPAVSRILRRLLEKAPQDRYPSATALIPDLEDALQQTRAGRTPQPAVEAPADLQRAMASTRKVVDEVVGTRGGIVNRFGVDQFTCIFGVPVTHEDDCVSATRAALELQSRLWPTLQGLISSLPKLGLQIGIASGLCIVQPARRGDSLYTLAGQPVEMASMLASHAAPGEILLPLECRRLVLPFFAVSGGQPLHLPDRPEPMSSLRILGESGVATRLEGATRAGLTDFTGREHELSAMLAHLGQALRGEGQLVTVVGDAGLGKSRLLHEFTRLLQGREVRLIRGRCSSRQGASPYFPFIEALQELLRVGTGQGSDLDPEMIASRIASISTKLSQFVPLYLHVLGIPSERHPPPRHLQGDRLRSAICEALSAIFTLAAGEQGAAVLLEDWHWADAASREGLRQLADIVPSHRLLLLITYRSGYGVVWGESTVHRTIQLGPLDLAASEWRAR